MRNCGISGSSWLPAKQFLHCVQHRPGPEETSLVEGHDEVCRRIHSGDYESRGQQIAGDRGPS